MKKTDFETRFVELEASQKLTVNKRTADLSKPKYTQTVHWHDHFELELVVAGSAVHVVNGISYRVCAGSMYLMSPADLHTLLPDPESDNPNLTVYNFGFNDAVVSGSSFVEALELPSPLTAEVPSAHLSSILATAQELFDEKTSDRFYAEELRHHLFMSLILRFLRLYKEQHPIGTSVHEDWQDPQNRGELAYIRKAVAYIKYNFRDSAISIPKIAKAIYLSPNYFGTVFKNHTGMSCVAYIKKLRMEFATGLLVHSPLTVAEISEKCGYINISYFISDFRQIYGIPPQKYREAQKENHTKQEH